MIGCTCSVCTSGDPRLIRTRSSIHLQTAESSILVDSGPDLREQALRENLTQVDAVLYTHAHLDHITGFDELRAFCWRRDTPLPLYGSPECLTEIKRIFNWAFLPTNTYKGYIKPDPRETSGSFSISSLTVTPLPVQHGSVETHGYLFEQDGMESFAYIPDAKTLPPETESLLENIPLLILDCLHRREHPTHMNLDESLATITQLGAKRAILTHISHELDINEATHELPKHITFAHDGLKISLAS